MTCESAPTERVALDGRTFLKVKIKDLAEEARSIRREERKTLDKKVRSELVFHRRYVVRLASRQSQLAYAFIRGRSRGACEPKRTECNHWIDSSEVGRLVKKFGRRIQPGEKYSEFEAIKADEAKRLADWIRAE